MTSATVTFMVSRLRGCEAAVRRVAAEDFIPCCSQRTEGGCLQPHARLAGGGGERKIIHTAIKLVSSRHTAANWFNIYLQVPACDLQLR